MPQIFNTQSHSWREVGLARQLSKRAVKRARLQLLVLMPLLAGTLVAYSSRREWFGDAWDTPVRIGATIALVMLGWQVARDVGRSLGPMLFRRLDPGTAGTVGFLIRFFTLGVAIIAALRVAGLEPQTLAVGGAFTAVVVGLAAQQTLGNLIAGTVLLSARPFRVGERVRLQGGPLAGATEGVVGSLGLLYTTLAQGDDQMMIPNSVVLNVAVMPMREPAGVDVRARFPADTSPLDVQSLLEHGIETSIRSRPAVSLEEIDGDEVVVRIAAVPEHAADGPNLASEVLDAVAGRTVGRAA
jgi:small conductance mechanosensitive channel